mgnify:FL=1
MPILAVVVASLLITGYTFRVVRGWETDRVQQAFGEEAKDRLLIIQSVIEQTLGIVQDLGSFFDAADSVGRREFREFVGPSLARHSYIKTLEWVPRVRGDERESFIREARRSFPRFQIAELDAEGGIEAGKTRDEHFPVLYVQPYQDNRDRLGLDLASSPIDLLTLTSAQESGSMHGSPPIRFKPKGADEWGFMVAMPVYRRQQEPGHAEETELADLPRGELRGFAIGVFRVADIVETALTNLSPAGINIHLYADDSTGRLLYTHVSRLSPRRGPAGPRAQNGLKGGSHRMALPLKVADQEWHVVSEAIPGAFQPARWSSLIVVIGGLAFTALLTF